MLSVKKVSILAKRLNLDFSKVKDTRASRSRTQVSLGALFTTMVVAIASGRRTLRDIEALTEDMSSKTKRHLGINRHKDKISDNPFYDRLLATKPEGFREALQQMVKADLSSKAITNDEFSGGVIAIDGKTAGIDYGIRSKEYYQLTYIGPQLEPAWKLLTLNACLTSSSAKPLLDRVCVPRDKGESTLFETIFSNLMAAYGKLFKYVTVDAGLSYRHNAELVLQADKDYLFCIKGNQGNLYKTLQEKLDTKAFELEHTEGTTFNHTRWFLSREAFTDEDMYPGAKQILKLMTIVVKEDKTTVEQRYFVTSISVDEMSKERLLKLIRLHWGIENGPHWTMDVIANEDTHQPCKQYCGPVIMAWLTAMAYNLMAVFRVHMPKKDNQWQPWRRIRQWIEQAVLVLELNDEVPQTS